MATNEPNSFSNRNAWIHFLTTKCSNSKTTTTNNNTNEQRTTTTITTKINRIKTGLCQQNAPKNGVAGRRRPLPWEPRDRWPILKPAPKRHNRSTMPFKRLRDSRSSTKPISNGRPRNSLCHRRRRLVIHIMVIIMDNRSRLIWDIKIRAWAVEDNMIRVVDPSWIIMDQMIWLSSFQGWTECDTYYLSRQSAPLSTLCALKATAYCSIKHRKGTVQQATVEFCIRFGVLHNTSELTESWHGGNSKWKK